MIYSISQHRNSMWVFLFVCFFKERMTTTGFTVDGKSQWKLNLLMRYMAKQGGCRKQGTAPRLENG